MKKLLALLSVCSVVCPVRAQSVRILNLSLEEVISTAQDQSPRAMMAKHNFRASYWQYRSFQAKLLPSLNLTGTVGNFNRSLIPLQNAETGEINYRENNNLNNQLNLSIDQNIPFTGGTVSVFTNLNRLDQFSPNDGTTYNSQPINITYLQPLRAFNSLKWEKKIEPKEYDRAKRTYLETMEDITLSATGYFFDLLLAQRRLEMSEKNYRNTETLYKIASERFKLGSITKSELLQLELRLLNDGLAINENRLEADRARSQLRSFLGYNETVEIVPVMPEGVPDITLDYTHVLELSYENSSFVLTQDLSLLEAQQAVAEANASRGLSAQLKAQFGLTQQASEFMHAYRNPMDQEILSLGFSIPIMDWGQGKGRVKMAQSREAVVRTQIEQAMADHRQEVMIGVMQFNNQKRQCLISSKADTIAQERYDLTRERFIHGTVGVTDVNTAQTEKDEAVIRYVTELRNYWQYYYTIRKMSLYDYLTHTNISAEFDRIVEN